MESATITTTEESQNELPAPLTLQFVTYPSGTAPRPSRDIQAAVRAHVTRRQHRQRRQGDPFRNSNISTHSLPESSGSEPVARSLPLPESSKRTRAKRGSKSVIPKIEPRSSTSSSSNSGSPSLLPFHGSTQEDPFWTFPIDYSPLIPPIIAHYIHNLALPVSELDGPTETGLLRTHWFPMAMMSRATMYSLLLMAASHYHSLSGSPQFESRDEGRKSFVLHPQVIFTLKARALDEINRCLRSDDLQLAVGDTTIGAVAKLAAFEAVFGDENAYRQHMSGLMRMLQIRKSVGDLLGPVDQFLLKLVGWIDVNAAYFTGAPFRRLLDLDVPEEILEPDPMVFAGTTQTRAELQSKRSPSDLTVEAPTLQLC